MATGRCGNLHRPAGHSFEGIFRQIYSYSLQLRERVEKMQSGLFPIGMALTCENRESGETVTEKISLMKRKKVDADHIREGRPVSFRNSYSKVHASIPPPPFPDTIQSMAHNFRSCNFTAVFIK